MTVDIIYPAKFHQRVTSASKPDFDWNHIMHLRAHGWTVWEVCSGMYRCAHAEMTPTGAVTIDEAWQMQKLKELGRRYF